eukprot:1406492-Pyramimonas_sp.AAC.1
MILASSDPVGGLPVALWALLEVPWAALSQYSAALGPSWAVFSASWATLVSLVARAGRLESSGWF